MKILFHAGTHKTATTSFQAICAASADVLASSGVHYPIPSKPWVQHSFIAWWMQAREYERIERFLSGALSEAEKKGCTTLLLSGEDFENALVEPWMAAKFEEIALSLGIEGVDWLFVHRDPVEYFKSIYSEKSKYDLSLNPSNILGLIDRYGYIAPGGRRYNYAFVFNMAKFVPDLRASVSGQVRVLKFEEFVSGFAGKYVLSSLVPMEVVGEVSKIADGLPKMNTRLGDYQIEENYTLNFLGEKKGSKFAKERSGLIKFVSNSRLSRRKKDFSGLAERFSKIRISNENMR